MTDNKFEWFKGDKILWFFILAISFASVFPVSSASSQLEYIVGSGTTFSHTLKHISLILAGLVIMRLVGIMRLGYLGAVGVIALLASTLVLFYVASTGKTIDGASASRWINVGGFSVQPSAFAYLSLVVYLCRYLAKKVDRKTNWKDAFFIFVPITIVTGLVIKDNGSTGLMIFGVSMLILILGQFSFKWILGYVSISILVGSIFVALALTTDVFGDNHRVNTWKSRIEVFFGKDEDKSVLSQAEIEAIKTKNYQIDRAKAAIANGGMFGVGPGKSAMKQSLPQSASDFIFALIVEEYGVVGGGMLIFCYFVILLRIIMIASKTKNLFRSLLAVSIALMFFVQFSVNIMVVVGLFPVTGQPLPLISYGGTAMLATYMMLGIVLSISADIQVGYDGGRPIKQTIEEINDIA